MIHVLAAWQLESGVGYWEVDSSFSGVNARFKETSNSHDYSIIMCTHCVIMWS